MKKIILCVCTSLLIATSDHPCFAMKKNVDEQLLIKRIEQLEQKTADLSSRLELANSEIIKLWVQRNKQKKENKEIFETNKNLGVALANQEHKIESVQTGLSQGQIRIDGVLRGIGTKSNWNFWLFLFSLILGTSASILFYRKMRTSSASISALTAKTEKINEDIVEKLNEDLEKLQKELVSQKKSNQSTESDHSLIKALADRITFMEMTLFRMDKAVRGHRQLSKSIAQMKDNLLANGYEIVDMLGKPYDSGMKVVANFIEDETLQPGEQVISGVIKPQINYKGVMIQSAQITVSQNS